MKKSSAVGSQSTTPIFPPLESPSLSSASRSPYGKATSPGERHQLIKLQEQIKQYEEDIANKDKIIEEMRKFDISFCPEDFDGLKQQDINMNKEELVGLETKVTNLKTQVNDYLKEIGQKDIVIESLKKSNSSLKEDLARSTVTLECNNKLLDEAKEAKDAFDKLQRRNDVVIKNLEAELKLKKGKLTEILIEKNDLETIVSDLNEQKNALHEQLLTFKDSLGSEFPEGGNDCTEITNEVKAIKFENKTLMNKIEILEEKLKSKDCEQQASRQTINRLVTKFEEAQKKTVDHSNEIFKLKNEKAILKEELEEIKERETCLNDKNMSLEKEIIMANEDIKTKDTRIDELQDALKSKTAQASGQEKLLTKLMDTLIPMLENVFHKSEEDNNAVDWIINCVHILIDQNVNTTEEKLIECAEEETNEEIKRKLSSNLSENYKQSLNEAKIAIDDLKMRLDKVNAELSHSKTVINTMTCEKNKYYKVLSELGHAMRLDNINKDIGFDMITDAIYARADQLQKLESKALTDQRLTGHALQRQLKELRDRIHTKDLHIDLLHKKLANLEGVHQSDAATLLERDRELYTSKRLSKVNRFQTEEIEELRLEIITLKSYLVEYEQLRALNITLDQQVKTLNAQMDKLELVRQKQCKRLADLKASFSEKEAQMKEFKESTEKRIDKLNQELKLTKSLLEDSKLKEQQMLDLRGVISRLLGLQLDSLSIPDYEIIHRLERLVTAHQSNVLTAYSMDTALKDINVGFHQDECVLHHYVPALELIPPVYPRAPTPDDNVEQKQQSESNH